MKNEVYREGDAVSCPVPANTASGAPVLIGSLPGVTACAEGTGGNPAGFASVWFEGAYRFTVTGAVAGYGLPIYIAGDGTLTTTVGTNTVFGYSLGTKGSGAGPLVVKIAEV
jgi:predicted RecA/RadA family phage recombinase